MAILSKVDMIQRDCDICDARYELMGFFEHCNGCQYEPTIDSSGKCKLSKARMELIDGNLQKAVEIIEND